MRLWTLHKTALLTGLAAGLGWTLWTGIRAIDTDGSVDLVTALACVAAVYVIVSLVPIVLAAGARPPAVRGPAARPVVARPQSVAPARDPARYYKGMDLGMFYSGTAAPAAAADVEPTDVHERASVGGPVFRASRPDASCDKAV